MTEIQALNQKVQEVKDRTEVVLKERYGANRTLGFLPVNDRRRLYSLFIWSERYHLSLESILIILFDHYDGFRLREKRKRNMGLPIKAVTLMGQASEDVIRKYLKEMYPNGEHEELSKQLQQQQQVHQTLENEHLNREPKLLSECRSLKEWLEQYNKHMSQISDQITSIREYLKKSARPYRNNPWR